MILIKTQLKNIPTKCTKCKFGTTKLEYPNGDYFYINPQRVRICSITGKKVPYVFNKEKNNWEYTKCKTCPLIDSERTMEI